MHLDIDFVVVPGPLQNMCKWHELTWNLLTASTPRWGTAKLSRVDRRWHNVFCSCTCAICLSLTPWPRSFSTPLAAATALQKRRGVKRCLLRVMPPTVHLKQIWHFPRHVSMWFGHLCLCLWNPCNPCIWCTAFSGMTQWEGGNTHMQETMMKIRAVTMTTIAQAASANRDHARSGSKMQQIELSNTTWTWRGIKQLSQHVVVVVCWSSSKDMMNWNRGTSCWGGNASCDNMTSSMPHGSLALTSRFSHLCLPRPPGLVVVRMCLMTSWVTDVWWTSGLHGIDKHSVWHPEMEQVCSTCGICSSKRPFVCHELRVFANKRSQAQNWLHCGSPQFWFSNSAQ